MSDLTPLHNIQEEKSSAAPSVAPSIHNEQDDTSEKITRQVMHTPPVVHQTTSYVRGRLRRGSSASRVEVDYFDPSGVKELRRTLTAQTAQTVTPAASSAESTKTVVDEPFDLQKTLQDMVEHRDAAAIKSRQLGVMFKDLRVVGLGATASYQPTIASVLNPLNIWPVIQSYRHPHVRDILHGFDGVVRSGEMCLVLGRPGSGCSTLLKTLANRRDEFHAVEGDVHYDSLSPEDVAKHFRGDVQYCPEDDIHFPTLTVGQTLGFAAKTRAPQARLTEQRSVYVENITNILSTIFGLSHVKNTPVGDAAIRGVSGGEKKRVSISEALATRNRIGAWDNSTRGLDSSTALEFGRALRIATDIDRQTTIVSIYQAGETLYELFDKVCVIYEGKMAYFGPADKAKQYFMDMGYMPANRQTTPDFLVAVTDPSGRILRPGAVNVPRTALEFAEYFRKSEAALLNQQDMKEYRAEFIGRPQRVSAYQESAWQEHAKTMNKKSPYTISIPMQARAVMVRRVQIILGNKLAFVLNLVVFVIQGVIIGTVFLRLPDSTATFFSRGGVIFFALLFSALSSMAEIPALYSQRPIVLRHQKAALYHPFIEALAMTLVDIPISFTISIIFGIIIYFIVGLQQSAQQFFIFYLFLFTLTIVMKAWFRAIAAAFESEATAQSVAGLALLALAIYTGYTIPKPSMIGALKWITYLNPIRFGFEALLTNEFKTLNGTCSSLVPSGPGYENITIANQVCTTVGSQAGQASVSGLRYLQLSFEYSLSHLWLNFGIVVVFGIGFITALLVFTEINTSSSAQTTMVLFKPGANVSLDKKESGGVDEEKGPESPSGLPDREAKLALGEQQHATDIFSWQHLQYTVPIPGAADRRLLDDVSGYVVPGKLTALMGESGAGKTTLLNVLAQRVTTGVVVGDRFVNGQSLPIDFQSQTGYCQQMDTHVPNATVREALLFSAKLRQPASVPLAEKEAYVETCLKMCGLEALGDAIVGSLGVEHRKRTTIAVELAAKPKLLLFLDEPTSGLDSQSAWAIMSFLRSLADNGQAILCTIHQPSAELFQVFDRLLLLRKGGQTVYFGDLGHNSSTLIHYFEKNGSRRCGPDENPAEFMLDVIGAGATATSKRNWHEVWNQSKDAISVQKQIEQIHAEGRNRPPVEATVHSEFATSLGYQIFELTKRNTISHCRDATYLIAKMVLNIASGLFIGFTFFKADDSLQGTQNKLFAVFMSCIVSVPLVNQLQVPFLNMRSIYEIRERPSRMYSWVSLVTSQILVELPWNILGSSLFYLCWYWTVGFHSSRAGYTYLIFGTLFPLYYTTIGLAVSSMAPNAEIAALLFSFLFSFVVTFNGVLQPFRQLHWWTWMYRLSPYTYLIEGLLGQAIGKQQMNCAAVEFVTLDPPSGTCGDYMAKFISSAGGYLTNPDATSACQFCAVRTTDEFLGNNFNIFYSHRWRNVGFMVAYIMFNVAATYFFTYMFRIRTGSLLTLFKRGSRKSS